jgi:hypothetical protein
MEESAGTTSGDQRGFSGFSEALALHLAHELVQHSLRQRHQMTDETERERTPMASTGLALGLSFGTALGDVGGGVSVGMIVGLVVGAWIDARAARPGG